MVKTLAPATLTVPGGALSPLMHVTTVSAGLVARLFGIVAFVAIVKQLWPTFTLKRKNGIYRVRLWRSVAPIWLSLTVVAIERLKSIPGVAVVERFIICARHLVIESLSIVRVISRSVIVVAPW